MVIFESYVGLTAELTVVISMGFHSGDSWWLMFNIG
jgi:hypothetical protein